MMIRSATALRNDYDGMVKLSTEKQEPIYLTRSGDGEMVFLPIALWEKRQAELNLIKITTPMQPPPGENLGGGFVNTYIRKTGMTKARSFLREKRI